MCGENTEKIKQNLSKEKKKVTQYPNVLCVLSQSRALTIAMKKLNLFLY